MADGTYPADVHGMLDIANQLTERLIASQSPVDLFAAVLATVHAIEWDPNWKEETSEYKTDAHRAFRCRHPEWDILRRVGNGMKHAEKRYAPHIDGLKRRPLEWEDDDFWDNAGRDIDVWFVTNDDGQERALTSVCLEAIRKLRAELSMKAREAQGRTNRR